MKGLAKNFTGFIQKHRFDFFILLFLLALALVQFIPRLLQQETIEIAIVAPVSIPNEQTTFNSRERVDSVQMYFDKVNAAGGVNGKRLVLKVYDDLLDPDRSVEVAEEIVESRAVAVLGNSLDRTSLAAKEVYDREGLPAITAVATADDVTNSPWYFRTTFNNSEQGEFIATYMENVFDLQNIYLVYTDIPYGRALRTAIKETLNLSEHPLSGEQQIAPDEEPEAYTHRILRELSNLRQSDREPDSVILLTPSSQAANILIEMRTNGFDYPIFAGDSLSSPAFPKRFEEMPQEQRDPGFFSNNIYSVTPIIFDIAGQEAQDFKLEFSQRYGYEPGWAASIDYDSANAVVRAIENILVDRQDLPATVFTGQNLQEDRELIRQGLSQINNLSQAVRGISRDFFFDERGESSELILMGLFTRKKFISAPIQLSILEDINLISDAERQLDLGELIRVGDRYFRKTHIIYTGIDINEIGNIDEKNSSFLVDFYLWFKYIPTAIDPEDIEFVNYDVNRLDSGERLTLGEPVEGEIKHGFKHTIYQMKADFYDQFDFQDYPFDRQILSIRFQHTNLLRKRVIYVFDVLGTNQMTDSELIERFKKNKVFGTITDWHIKKINYYQSTDVDDSTLGYQELVNTDLQLEYSQFNLEIEIERDLLSFSIKNLLPLWFFVLVSYSLMFLPFADISAEAIGGVLLAVVFYHLSLLDSLPDGVGYVVALDYAFYLLYFLMGLQLLLVILGNSQAFLATGVKTEQLIRFGQIAFPTIWLVGCLVWYSIYAY